MGESSVHPCKLTMITGPRQKSLAQSRHRVRISGPLVDSQDANISKPVSLIDDRDLGFNPRCVCIANILSSDTQRQSRARHTEMNGSAAKTVFIEAVKVLMVDELP